MHFDFGLAPPELLLPHEPVPPRKPQVWRITMVKEAEVLHKQGELQKVFLPLWCVCVYIYVSV